MLRYLLFLIAFATISCSVSRKKSFADPNKSKNEALAFVDSLKDHNLKPIIVYQNGCSGCVTGIDREWYVFHNLGFHGASSKLTKFSTYSTPKTVDIFNFSTKYLLNIADSLATEKLTAPNSEMAHGPYYQIIISTENHEINYQMSKDDIRVNEDTFHVKLLDKISSFLFRLPEWKWYE